MKSFLSLIFAFLLISFIAAQDNLATNAGAFDFDIVGEEDTAPKIVSSPDLLTATIFPKYNDAKFPGGSDVEVLVGFRNKGSHTFNITHAQASFHYPLDYSYYIQNFTSQYYGIILRPEDEVTVSYIFMPDPLLEQRDFGLVVSVHYKELSSDATAAGVNYTNILYNATVDIVEPDSGFDAQSFFAYVAILAVLGLISYILYRNLSSWTKHQKRGGGSRGDKIEGAGTSEKIDNDWLTGTAADPSLKRRKANTNSPNLRGSGSPNTGRK